MNRHRQQRGYSLAEILVAIAIFAVIILAALTAYDRGNKMFKQGVESTNMQQNTRVAFDKLVADLRMAGYDFDRDGIPLGAVTAGANQYQQPDEQFEYIGPSAITIRANFDYETESAPCPPANPDNCENGRERSLESAQFPVITTANDEIVTYALRPASMTTIPACDPATNCIRFYADVAYPKRKAYPDGGGADETLVEIPGVDLCNGGCNNPPYTLYRFTLRRDASTFTGGANIIETPIATNIRNLNFTYYQDARGSVPLKNLTDTVDVSTGATILGNGQYRVNAPSALVTERTIRAKINSLRVELTGMNEAPDRSYRHPTETVAAAQQYRQYALQTLVAPRNIQKRGMKEQDSTAPGPPTNVQVCTGRCGGLYVTWDAPLVNNAYGAPDQYKIVYDLASASGYRYSSTTFTSTYGYVFGIPNEPALIPNQPYKLMVVALNSHGSGSSAAVSGFIPRNSTQPGRPLNPTATTDQTGKVVLTWQRPTVDNGTYACTEQIPALEISGYQVQRRQGTSGTFTTIATVSSADDNVTWEDTTVRNCVDYQYQIVAVEACMANAAYNTGNNLALASSEPSTPVVTGRGVAVAPPIPPAPFQVLQDAVNSPCVGVNCNVKMHWPKVTLDTGNRTINVDEYRLYRRAFGATTWPATAHQTIAASASDPNPIVFVDNSVSIAAGARYEYKVQAAQCTAGTPMISGESNYQTYPCPFPAAAVHATTPVTATNVISGSGTATDPWLIEDSTTVALNAVTASQIAQVDLNIYDGDRRVMTATQTSGFSFPLTLDQETIVRVDMMVTATNGCTTSYTRYIEDLNQACCLIPYSADTTVMSFSAGNNYVDFYLKNRCSAALTLRELQIGWSTANAGGGQPDLVSFPDGGAGTGNRNVNNPDATFTVSIPSGADAVPANSSTYRIRVRFNRTLPGPGSPITSFTPLYRRSTDLADVTCPIR